MLAGVNYSTGSRNAEIQGWIKSTGGNADGKGVAAVLNNTLSLSVITHTLNFTKDLATDFNLNLTVGYEYFKSDYHGRAASGYQFDYNLDQANRVPLHYYNNMQDAKQANIGISSFRNPTVEIQSYFARAILNYHDRFLLTGTIRSDGSSKFGSGNKYAYFPSVAAAWNVTNEGFFKDNGIFNNLRVRFGYGETGNQEFPADASLNYLTYSSYGSITRNHYGSDTLKWETVKSIDAGIDFAILKGRIYGFVDYFDKKTVDPVFLTVISQPTAGGSVYKNISGADVTNTGFEISVGADIVQGKSFSWSANANVTTLKNRFHYPKAGTVPFALTGALHGQGISGGYSQAIANDQPVDVFYLPTFTGFDKDGIGTYTPINYVGDPNPHLLLGFSTDLSYKKLTLSMGFHGTFGNMIYNNTANSVINISNISRWQKYSFRVVTSGESVAMPSLHLPGFLKRATILKCNLQRCVMHLVPLEKFSRMLVCMLVVITCLSFQIIKVLIRK